MWPVVVLRTDYQVSGISIDNRYSGRSIYGDPMTGMLAGANIQLIYLGWISAGGTMPSNTIVAGIVWYAMTILSGADPTMAVTFAIPFSMLGLLQNQVYMTTNAAWIHQADKMLEKGNLRGVRLMNFLPSFCMAFLLYGVPAFAMVMFGSGWAESLINAVPENVISALQVVGGIMPALGIAITLQYIFKGEARIFLFLGFMIATVSGMTLIEQGIVGLIMAIIYIQLAGGKTAVAATAGAPADGAYDPDYDPDDTQPTDDTIDKATGYIGQSMDDLIAAIGSPQYDEYEDEPDTGKTGYHYYSNFTVSTNGR